MSDRALIKVVLYATLSLIVYTVNREAARFSLTLPSFRIVRPCCLVDRCQRFGGNSCLHFQDKRVIVRLCSLVDTNVSEDSLVLLLRCRKWGDSQVFGNVSGPLLQGRTVDVMSCKEEIDASINVPEETAVSIFKFRIKMCAV
jgi:hypothetical protein